MPKLLMFYGTECVHCHELMPLVEKLEEEEGVKVERLEVWHDSKNKTKIEGLDKGKCGGVPFLYNEKTKATICGSATYEGIKKWAKG
jgi:thiol-disulfide isomerase/thioredoxin